MGPAFGSSAGFMEERLPWQAFGIYHPVSEYFVNGQLTSSDGRKCLQISGGAPRYLKTARNIFQRVKISSTSSIFGYGRGFNALRAMPCNYLSLGLFAALR